jgi:hypothetical protein
LRERTISRKEEKKTLPIMTGSQLAALTNIGGHKKLAAVNLLFVCDPWSQTLLEGF